MHPNLKPPPPSSSTLRTADRTVLDTGVSSPVLPQMSEEISCSICLDIMVHPQTIVPCGHSFCGKCLDSIKECPQCRETITSRVPSLQLESLICAVVQIPNMIDVDDKEHYQERLKKETPQGFQDLSQPSRKRSKRSHNHSHSSSSRRAREAAAAAAAAAGMATSYTTTRIIAGGVHFSSSSTSFHVSSDGGSVTIRQEPRQNSRSSRRNRAPSPLNFLGAASSSTSTPSQIAPTSVSTSASNLFDPMLAPLPPPFDYEGTSAGVPPAPPIWGLAGSSNNGGSTSAIAGTLFAAVSMSRAPQGTSIEDAICID